MPRLIVAAAALALLSLPLPIAAEEPLVLTLEGAEASHDMFTGLPVLQIRLAKKSQARFAKFTGEHVGKRADFMVDGEVLSSPVIQMVINQPELQISGLETPAEVAGMVAKLRDGDARVEIRLAAE